MLSRHMASETCQNLNTVPAYSHADHLDLTAAKCQGRTTQTQFHTKDHIQVQCCHLERCLAGLQALQARAGCPRPLCKEERRG
jgi:hypothetical protein